MSDALTSMVAALRARSADHDDDLVDATRLRLRRSLEVRARARVRAVRALVIAGIVLGATGAWALSTGRASALWIRISGEPAPAIAPPEPATKISMRLDEPHRKPAARQELAIPDPGWPAVPETAAVPPPTPAIPKRPAPPVVIDPLYRKAHELHFHGTDHAQALAAWDAYLVAEPNGRFGVEARYNRALVLVRLARHAEARSALEPFARGEVAPAGYRKREAAALVERLTAIESEPIRVNE